MNRRQFIGVGIGAAAAVAVLRLEMLPASADPSAPGHAGMGTPGDMAMQNSNGKWSTHLLPFADDFPTQAAMQAQIARSKQLGLFK